MTYKDKYKDWGLRTSGQFGAIDPGEYRCQLYDPISVTSPEPRHDRSVVSPATPRQVQKTTMSMLLNIGKDTIGKNFVLNCTNCTAGASWQCCVEESLDVQLCTFSYSRLFYMYH